MNKTVNDWIEALKSDDKDIRKKAVLALGYMGADAVAPLMANIADPQYPQALVADIFRQIGEPAISALADSLQSADAAQSMTAANLLGLIGDTRAVLPLVMALDRDDEQVRASAAAALGHFSDPRATKRLTEAAADPSPAVRAKTAQALGNYYRDGRVVDVLISLAKDDDALVRAGAMRGMARLEDERVLSILQAGTEDVDSEVRHVAAAAIQLRGGDRMVFERNHGNTDEAAAAVVDKIFEDDALDESDLDLLRASNARVRAAILEKIGDRPIQANAVKLLIPGLNDINPAVRKSAVESIARLGTTALPALTDALQDKSKYIRTGALEVMSIIGDEQIIAEVIPLLKDKEVMVRRQAVMALAQFKDDERVPRALRPLRKDADKDIREQVEAALETMHSGGNPVARLFKRLTGD